MAEGEYYDDKPMEQPEFTMNIYQWEILTRIVSIQKGHSAMVKEFTERAKEDSEIHRCIATYGFNR